MLPYELLEWDSAIFGYPVAKIVPSRMSAIELTSTLHALKSAAVKLVYWASDVNDAVTQVAARAQGGLLVDRKTTYLKTLSCVPAALSGKNTVEFYTATTASPALEFLALESGSYSRFKTDPRVEPAIFEEIYRQWITNSVRKQIAQEILIVQHAGELAGMATLGTKNGRGDIGLLAVQPQFRGLKIGADLFYAAQNWCSTQELAQCQVVTQGDNKPACSLYEKCGFVVDKVENFYHFWL